MLKKFLLIGVAAVFMSTAVLAADVESPPAEYDWSGFYAGVIAGYSWSNFDVSAPVGDEPDFDRNQSFDVDGGLVGVEIGWNHQMDSFVFGLAADISMVSAEDDSVYDLDSRDEYYIGKMDWLGTVRAKVGFAMDNILIYATGGLAVTGAALEFEDRNETPVFHETEGDTLFGWTAGGGAEIALGDVVSIKAEYLYADFETLSGEFDLTGTDRDVDIDTHIVRGGVNFRF